MSGHPYLVTVVTVIPCTSESDASTVAATAMQGFFARRGALIAARPTSVTIQAQEVKP